MKRAESEARPATTHAGRAFSRPSGSGVCGSRATIPLRLRRKARFAQAEGRRQPRSRRVLPRSPCYARTSSAVSRSLARTKPLMGPLGPSKRQRIDASNDKRDVVLLTKTAVADPPEFG